MNVEQVSPRDAIPSVDEPVFDETYFGDRSDEVLVYAPDEGPTRAYPIRILHYHEIVNDEATERPIAVTWCPLSGSAIVYDRTVDDEVLSFGVSGTLADDDLVMSDRETGSEWKQSSGTCIAGELEGTELDVLPANVLSWERFVEQYPDGVTLSRPDGESEPESDGERPGEIDYRESPYDAYFEREGFGLAAHRGDGDEASSGHRSASGDGDSREWDREDIEPKSVVLGIERDGEALGVPLPTVEVAGGVVPITIGGDEVVVFATRDGIHAFDNPGFDFARAAEPGVFRGDGARWDGATGESDDGRALDLVPTRRLFAFAWQDDHGPDTFYRE